MAVASYADVFRPDFSSCNEIQNAGSIIKVSTLYNCLNEPPVYTLTAAAATVGAASIQLTFTSVSPAIINNAAGTAVQPASYQVLLSKGTNLYFGSSAPYTVVTVAQDTVVAGTAGTTTTAAAAGSATTVPVNPLTSALSAGTTTTWGLLQLVSPTDIPITDQDQTVDRMDLSYGLQGSNVKTSIGKQSQVTSIAVPGDAAFWGVIFPGSQQAGSVFTHIARNGGVHAWGPAKIMNLSMPGAIKEIMRPAFQIDFQAPYASPTLRSFITDPNQQAAYDTVMRLSGM